MSMEIADSTGRNVNRVRLYSLTVFFASRRGLGLSSSKQSVSSGRVTSGTLGRTEMTDDRVVREPQGKA